MNRLHKNLGVLVAAPAARGAIFHTVKKEHGAFRGGEEVSFMESSESGSSGTISIAKLEDIGVQVKDSTHGSIDLKPPAEDELWFSRRYGILLT
jgi:hypothetical protein